MHPARIRQPPAPIAKHLQAVGLRSKAKRDDPMWIPDWLYERLPLLYVAAGAACLLLLGPTMASLPSALLFIAAGLRTYALRRSDRLAGPLRSKRRLAHVRGGKHKAPRYARG
jgi:hypothetical protein